MMCEAVIPLIATLVGGLVAIVGGFAAQWWHLRHLKRSVAKSIAGEICAILDIIERRGYVRTLNELISDAQQNKQVQWPYMSLKYDYFEVYHALGPQMGLLDSANAARAAKFYTYTKALLEDVTEPSHKDLVLSPEDAIEFLQHELGLLNDLISLGQETVSCLGRE